MAGLEQAEDALAVEERPLVVLAVVAQQSADRCVHLLRAFRFSFGQDARTGEEWSPWKWCPVNIIASSPWRSG
jgi:hypothetical protein